MFKILYLFIVSFFLIITPGLSQENNVELEPQIVAEVNGVKISKKELEQELRSNLKDEVDSFDQDQKHVLLRTMLQKMVERALLLQEAKTMIPSDEELKLFVSTINANLPEKESFNSQLKEFGVDKSKYLSRLKEELGIKKYLDEKLFKNLTVSETEIKDFYINNHKDYSLPKQVCARHIFVKIPDNASEEVIAEKKQKTEEIRKKFSDKKNDFATIARRFSEASNRGKGGDLGCFTQNQLPKSFSEKAFELKAKEISEVVRTAEGFHIIKVSRHKGGETPELEEIKDRIEKRVIRSKREGLLNDHIKKLTEKGKVIVYYR